MAESFVILFIIIGLLLALLAALALRDIILSIVYILAGIGLIVGGISLLGAALLERGLRDGSSRKFC